MACILQVLYREEAASFSFPVVQREPIMLLTSAPVHSTWRLCGLFGRRSLTAAATLKYDNVLVEQKERVGIIQLNRQKVTWATCVFLRYGRFGSM